MDNVSYADFSGRSGLTSEVSGVNPQVENGYTRISNELIEAIMMAPLTSHQFRVVMAVIRLTYGYKRSSARITGNHLAELTGLPRQSCSGLVADLLETNVLDRDGGSRGELGINKHYDLWLLKKHVGKPRNRVQSGTRPRVSRSSDERDKVTLSETLSVTLSETSPTPPIRSKENLKEIEAAKAASSDGSDAAAEACLEEQKKCRANPVDQKIGPCPHDELVALFREHFPSKPQPKLIDEDRKKAMRSVWRFCATVPYSKTGKPLYETREQGLFWWRRFMRYIAGLDFCMNRQHNFGFDWLMKRSSIKKIMDGNYEDEGRKQ